jgi:ABC-type transport system involved in Fe-S cluster assembly fused permease/ATPase subunit
MYGTYTHTNTNTHIRRERERNDTCTHEHTHAHNIFLNSDGIANFQGERAESARLAMELQQAREIILLLQVSLRWHSVRPNTLVVKASCSNFRLMH